MGPVNRSCPEVGTCTPGRGSSPTSTKFPSEPSGYKRSPRYLHEGIEVLADRAPDLHEALDRCRRDGMRHVVLDGTLIESDRFAGVSENGNGLWFSQKHRRSAAMCSSSEVDQGFRAGADAQSVDYCPTFHEVIGPYARANWDNSRKRV
ncbi:hypothetical protein ACFV3F_28715 [Streptomyces sp. NPDC059717]|uniref:hypothetical protein n=1 Tax=Streptomyces sp. NPDC059717 TaxID=3346922 RepID=UPI003680C3FE